MTRPAPAQQGSRTDSSLASTFSASTKAARPCAIALMLVLVLFTLAAAQAQTFTVLHTFSGLDGLTPYSGVTLDAAGNLYGTTYGGGPHGFGSVYQLKRRGSSYIHYQLYAFTGGPDGAYPYAGVVFGPDGQLYGTELGNADGGAVFSLRPQMTICRTVSCPWTETVLFRFASIDNSFGAYYGKVAFDRSGNLYGTNTFGGAHSYGDVYQLTRSGSGWTGAVLYSFPFEYYPDHSVVVDGSGNLFGTTASSGQFDAGVVFEVSPNGSGWTEQDLVSLGAPGTGGYSVCGLIMDSAGNLYGGETGNSTNASVFEMSPSGDGWQLSILYTWSYSNNVSQGPVGNLVLDGMGNLYGTTYSLGTFGYGNIFKLTRNGSNWTYTDLYDFQNNGDGAYPTGDLSIDSNGNIYGTTSGDQSGHGTVWKLTP